jgi:hypothetical protein
MTEVAKPMHHDVVYDGLRCHHALPVKGSAIAERYRIGFRAGAEIPKWVYSKTQRHWLTDRDTRTIKKDEAWLVEVALRPMAGL